MSWNDLKSFYMRAIILWTLPVLIFLFTITGITNKFIYSRVAPTVFAIILPTLYLCIIDSIAIRAGTWHINEKTSLELFVWSGLPIEEAIFFLVTNTMVVLGCSAFDLAFSIIHTFNQTDDFSFASLCYALLQDNDEQVVEDLVECVRVLRQGSSSFYTSSFFFKETIRRDLVVLYAFCRYTDDVTDNVDIQVSVRSARIEKLAEFVMANFLPRANLRMLRFLSHKVPREPLIELLEGYAWDLNLDTAHERRIRFEEDLVEYARHVASSVAELCVYVVDPAPQPAVLCSAREMGVVLQLTNVARDILTDAVKARTYVPEAWFGTGERDALLKAGRLTPERLEHDTTIRALKPEQHALRLLTMADTMHKRSAAAIAELPEESQIGIRIATDGYYAIGKRLAEICKLGQYPMRARLPTHQKVFLSLRHLYTMRNSEILLLGGCILRLILLFYGHWQDSLGTQVKYTDIDYRVFTDAARFMQAGGSPYDRATYRYTPLLAWLLIPNQYFASWGKVLFAGGDILAGWLMILLLRARHQRIEWSAAWLLNPMVAVISTRGNCEGLLGALAIALLYAIEKDQITLAGLVLGTAVHFKIYPIIYAPSIVLALNGAEDPQFSWTLASITGFFNRQRLVVAIVSFSAFSVLSALMFHFYGMEFVQHTFLYHISRSDHRHNFSPYHLFLYFKSSAGPEAQGSTIAALLAFLPQMLLSMVILPLFLARKSLTTCFFAQTFAFVAFNKVVTSQYFMWYLVFLPLYLPTSPLLSFSGLAALILWIAGQGLWLYYAYGFEILGNNTFNQMWIATLLFFAVNMYILGKVVNI
ncbi:protein of unknown function [Taphrina deformans PYCC 5710]|uniref:Bifunctional lycopene cyclase/phytoene synthase n=1 Tax=Taphrina deformans (strain PYCC 5710 / ATCC 11124 / CBS 356.35 / IMI 108563 / JCM 9778 / NBRC 8474) TaxID=1097556 RepID=R4XGH3_TAPDE|nr:protein of unknown function [Taphrina deformans PYCC 5710]|eukprot:CCG84997.1 protein of unknown function [Taphrina deformans PYCC 5710]